MSDQPAPPDSDPVLCHYCGSAAVFDSELSNMSACRSCGQTQSPVTKGIKMGHGPSRPRSVVFVYLALDGQLHNEMVGIFEPLVDDEVYASNGLAYRVTRRVWRCRHDDWPELRIYLKPTYGAHG